MSSQSLDSETPPGTPPITPTNLKDEVQSDDDLPLLDVASESSVDTDSSGMKAKLEELEKQCSSTPILSISQSQLTGRQPSESLQSSSAAANQLSLPLFLNIQSGRASVSSNQATFTLPVQATPVTVANGEKMKASKLSVLPSPLSKPLQSSVAGESQVDDKTTAKPHPLVVGEVGEQPVAISGEKQLLQQGDGKCDGDGGDADGGGDGDGGDADGGDGDGGDNGGDDDDDDADVIEIEDDSEVDNSTGGAEGEEKGNSASADALSSDDEWDESLLPPRYVLNTEVVGHHF